MELVSVFYVYIKHGMNDKNAIVMPILPVSACMKC